MAAERVDPAFEAPYTLGAGDRLRVVVFGQDGLSNTYAVDGAGKITMPLIGPIAARGKTTGELASAISAKLKAGYIREPHVAVEVEAFRPFFILGEVTNAGQYAYVNGLTVQSAVAIAGGFSPRALKTNAHVSRIVDGRTVTATVPLSYPLRPGDTVTIDERWF
ncbi:MAG TPA: polysaccharide biosynthesis/export family protein [Xanthobacteraceae bacterium]|nr:polysaccharide biosynthesis/export family protein [Xanthobacteraceae bacterium]